MACYRPLTAFQCFDGSVVFVERQGDVVRRLSLPCGQCVGCRLERSRQWAMRCMHEASLWPANCFITLTYSDEHLPESGSLEYDDFQKFMKRLRKRFRGVAAGPSPSALFPIRFYMAGEYGENFGRPHFHACVFNFDFPDKTLWMKTKSGSRIFRSKSLEELWPFGYSSIGDVNFQSAAYVARYIMKKITGKGSEYHYQTVSGDGEILERKPEFNKMSLKPGIGAGWFEKFRDDVYPHDFVVVNGKKVKPPRYYDGKFKKEYPLEFEDIQWRRQQDAMQRAVDSSDERLAVREQVALAQVSRLPRVLK